MLMSVCLLTGMHFGRHSVVEVFTSRTANVDHHRAIQEAVRIAVMRALTAIMPPKVRACAWQSM